MLLEKCFIQNLHVFIIMKNLYAKFQIPGCNGSLVTDMKWNAKYRLEAACYISLYKNLC